MHESVGLSIASDYSTIPMTIHAAPFFSLLPLEGGRKKGLRETVLPHSGKPTPPRFARLPLPEEGARMIFKETLIQSLSFAVRDSRFPPHMPRCSVFFISLSYRLCPIRPFGAPSPRGEGWRYEENLRSTDLRASPHIFTAKPPPSFLIQIPSPPLKIFLDFPSPKVYSSFNFIKAVKRRVHEGRWQRELHPVRRSADESMEDGL